MIPDWTEGACVIRLPFLRGGEEKNFPEGPQVLRLWPGLPEMPESGWHWPQNFPLSALQARRYLGELEALDADGLCRVWNTALARENLSMAAYRREMDELQHFEREGRMWKIPADENGARLEAQKFLLWIWLAQKRAEEIGLLAKKFATSALRFSLELAEGDETPSVPMDGEIRLDERIWPSWQSVLYNALYFLPANGVIFAEGTMRAELLEKIAFNKTGWAGILGAVAEAREILGLTGKKVPPSHRKKVLFLAEAS